MICLQGLRHTLVLLLFPHPIFQSPGLVSSFILPHVFFKKLFIDFREREGGRGERQRDRQFVVLLIHALICCFMYVPCLGIEPAPMVYQDNALTNWATWSGPPSFFYILSEGFLYHMLLTSSSVSGFSSRLHQLTSRLPAKVELGFMSFVSSSASQPSSGVSWLRGLGLNESR